MEPASSPLDHACPKSEDEKRFFRDNTFVHGCQIEILQILKLRLRKYQNILFSKQNARGLFTGNDVIYSCYILLLVIDMLPGGHVHS